MLALVTKNRFKRELRLAARRGKKLDKLWHLVTLLQSGTPLPPRHRNHLLSGGWSGCYECHIEPDWLLVYIVSDTDLVLVATGTHADLFE